MECALFDGQQLGRFRFQCLGELSEEVRPPMSEETNYLRS